MKTFTATHLNKHAQEVFAAARDEPVYIEHDRFSNGAFVLVWHDEITFDDVKDAAAIMDSLDVNKDTSC